MLEKDVKRGKRIFTINNEDVEVDMEDVEYIFKGMRPRLMDYETFKEIRRILEKELKEHLRGRISHMSKMSKEAWKDFTKEMGSPMQRGHTYKKVKK